MRTNDGMRLKLTKRYSSIGKILFMEQVYKAYTHGDRHMPHIGFFDLEIQAQGRRYDQFARFWWEMGPRTSY